MEATALKDTPVDRMLSKKRAGVEGATKDNFERELSRTAFHNSGSLSICGKCHFKVGHTRRNCDGAECTSAMLCGIIDKHPNDKAVRRNLSQQVTKCETELENLQSDYNSKLSAYKTVEDSFARKIEAAIVASNPDRYFVNGVKNWALLNKHVALLQKRCMGKMPPRHSVVNLLKVAVEEHELKSQRLHAKERFVNPKKHILEDEYAIRFPRGSPSTARACSSSSFPGSSLLSAEEESDFRMAVRLQAELNNQTLCGGSRADCVTFREGNEESNYCGMFVPARAGKHLRLSLNHQLREKKKR